MSETTQAWAVGTLPAASLDQILRTARTYYGWTDAPVSEAKLREVYELMKWGPTSANSCPARFVWVRSAEGKERLAALAMAKNRPKILQAPVTVIIGSDLDFAERLPQLLPHNAEAMQRAFSAPGAAEATATCNATLQGAYLMIAARALGLDCGPMSGFDGEGVNKAFFAGTNVRSNFICSLGHSNEASLFPRGARLSFEASGRFA